MNDAKNIREEVAAVYSKAVTNSGSVCCSSCCEPTAKGAVASLAGYSRKELSNLPADAVLNSFGCGNPLAFAGVKEGDVVLDLGSGAGIDILIAGKMVGPSGKAIGIDMTDDMIARANENIAASGLKNVEVRKGIIEDLPVESSTVDWVISNCVINLSPEKDRVFAEVARVLKPGGRISISDIVVKDLPDWVLKSSALYGSCVSGAISEEKYISGLESAGIGEIEVVERLVYDKWQLSAFMNSVLVKEEKLIDGKNVWEIASLLEGKIWSAKFTGKQT